MEQYFENGRRYCSPTYYMPNDDEEQTRLTINHQAFLSVLDGRLTLGRIAPGVTRILDIGTGPGDWAIAVGEQYPDAEVVATDISPFPSTAVPPNVFFEIDDAQEEWTYSDVFDFIHIRGLAGAFADWPAIYASAMQHLRPGGCVEVADFGLISVRNSIPGSYIGAFNGACQAAAEKAGTPIGSDHLRKSVIEAAGLSVVKSRVIEVPLGPWSSDRRKAVAGKMALVSALEGLEAMSLRLLTREMAWKPEAVRDLCEKVKGEITRPGVRAFYPCHFVVARKVLDYG
jgi:SAM-dependent methyltransferase